MLNKNQIIEELKNEDSLVRNAVYEYVCKLHLYDDEDINKAFIEFLEENYNQEINYSGLICSKLNRKIIESLLKIHEKEEKLYLKIQIENVLIRHYNIIKDMDYNFEELIKNEEYLLIYKKIKHFSKKDPEQLLKLYIKSINNFVNDNENNDEEAIKKEMLISAMGTALIQTKKGELLLSLFVLNEVADKKERDNFFGEYIPYVIFPLCECASDAYHTVIQTVYYFHMDFIGYQDECNYYFSSICNKEFINSYLKVLKTNDIEDYYYDICEYLNSEVIDDFLLKSLDKVKNEVIKEEIIIVLASKFNSKVIPYAIEYLNNKDFEREEELKLSLAPLFLVNKYETDVSKKVIEDAKKYLDFDEYGNDETVAKVLANMQGVLLENKPHIKEYKKIRKLHNEVMQSIVDYYMQGKFELKIENKQYSNNVTRIDSKFDTSTELGKQAMANIIAYKNAVNMNCITEEFINKNKFKSNDKIELLQSMLNSSAGLFEIIETDKENGKVHLKDVLSGKEFWITDIAFSGNMNTDKMYIYTRVITYHDISFGTGLNIIFSKYDSFINDWISKNKPIYKDKQEITRFMELYNEYSADNKGMEVIPRNV